MRRVMNIIIVLLLAILQWKEARRNAYNISLYLYISHRKNCWATALAMASSVIIWWFRVSNAGTPHSTSSSSSGDLIFDSRLLSFILLFLLKLRLLRSFVRSFVRSLKQQAENWDLRAKVIGKVATIAGSNSAWKLSPMFVLFFFSFSWCGNMSINNCATS